jgi:UDP-N-acetylmuramate dehydrogenase
VTGRHDGVEEAARMLGPRARRDVPIGPLTTYRVGGPAALCVEAVAEEDLVECARTVAATGVDVLVVGRGSNLLVADAGFHGLAVLLAGAHFDRIDLPGGGVVEAGAAVQLPVLARRTAAAGLTGLEWAVGVPGSVGGAVRMNAGGHGADVSRSLLACGLFDLALADKAAVVSRGAAEMDFGYRRSAVTGHQVVVWARFGLAPGNEADSAIAIRDIVRWRLEHQPGGQNAGSVFTNPEGDSAGRLIDEAGLKGLRWGTAQVSEKHANFIQADDGGSADDVFALIGEVRRLVAQRLGVRLEVELRTVGFSPPDPQPSTITGESRT